MMSSSGPSTAGERLTFSSVARLGFAAAHDSPVQIAPKIDPPRDSAANGNLLCPRHQIMTFSQ